MFVITYSQPRVQAHYGHLSTIWQRDHWYQICRSKKRNSVHCADSVGQLDAVTCSHWRFTRWFRRAVHWKQITEGLAVGGLRSWWTLYGKCINGKSVQIEFLAVGKFGGLTEGGLTRFDCIFVCIRVRLMPKTSNIEMSVPVYCQTSTNHSTVKKEKKKKRWNPTGKIYRVTCHVDTEFSQVFERFVYSWLDCASWHEQTNGKWPSWCEPR